MLFEYHMTVCPEAPLLDLKKASFRNYQTKANEFLIPETFYTWKEEHKSVFNAVRDCFIWPKAIGYGNVKRVKVETGALGLGENGAQYYEAHVRVPNWIPVVPKFVHRSLNSISGLYWLTCRSHVREILIEQYAEMQTMFAKEIEEREIESVVFDSNPGLDTEWFTG
jgi:hypothetical protein